MTDTVLYSVAQFIESLSDCPWILGENLFVGFMPLEDEAEADVPVRRAAVLELDPAGLYGDLPDWQEKPIQLLNQSNDYKEARDDAYCVYESLHGQAGWALPVVLGGPSYEAMVIEAMGTPAPIENPNEKGNFVFSTNFMWSIANPSGSMAP